MKQKENSSLKQLVPELRFPEFANAGVWEERKLGEIGEVVSGLTYSPDDVNEKGVLVLRSSNIQDGVLSFEDNVFVKTNSYNAVKENDILICVRNGSRNLIGKNALIKKESEGMAFGAFMSIYRSNYNLFLYQWFSSDFFFNQVKKNLGATINSINGNDLKKYKVFFPSLPEQQKIADCLSSLDDVISLESQKLKSLLSYKKGLLQNLFPAEGETVPRLRFPEFEGTVDWEERKLGEVATPVTERANETQMHNILSLTAESGLVLQSDYFGKKIAGTDVSRYIKIKEHDFVYNDRTTKSYPYGALKRLENIESGIVSPIYKCFRFGINQNSSFWSHYFESGLHEIEIKKLVNEGARAGRFNISISQFLNISVKIPSGSEQQKIANCLSSVDALIQEQSDRVEKLKSHKKGLLQGLFPVMGE